MEFYQKKSILWGAKEKFNFILLISELSEFLEKIGAFPMSVMFFREAVRSFSRSNV